MKLINDKDNKIVIRSFDSISELAKYVSQEPKYGDSSIVNDESFTGTKNFEEAYELMSKGSSVNLDYLIKSFKKELNGLDTIIKNKHIPISNIYGYCPIVPNALLGLPNSMIDFNTVSIKRKCIKIHYITSTPSSTSKKLL